jgi:hypothetical protein
MLLLPIPRLTSIVQVTMCCSRSLLVEMRDIAILWSLEWSLGCSTVLPSFACHTRHEQEGEGNLMLAGLTLKKASYAGFYRMPNVSRILEVARQSTNE